MQDFSNMTIEQLKALAASLTAENAKLAAPRPITFRVAEKTKALSVYGLNSRFPVTLYKGQWERLLAKVDDMRAFIAAHPELAVKGEVADPIVTK